MTCVCCVCVTAGGCFTFRPFPIFPAKGPEQRQHLLALDGSDAVLQSNAEQNMISLAFRRLYKAKVFITAVSFLN